MCFFDELVRPPGTTTNGTGCVKGGTVRNHHDCVLTKPGYLCAQGVCKDSKWVEDPLCHPIGAMASRFVRIRSRLCDAGCGFKKTNMPRVIVRGHNKNVSVPVNSKDADCQVGRITPSGRKCVFVRYVCTQSAHVHVTLPTCSDGFDCEPASCSQGVWSNVMPKCIAGVFKITAVSGCNVMLFQHFQTQIQQHRLRTQRCKMR